MELKEKPSKFAFEFKSLKDKEFRRKLANTYHTYKLEDLPSGMFSFYFYADAGTGDSKQAAVKNKMVEVAINSNIKPAFMIDGGDGFYHNGVNSEDDAAFEEKFNKYYEDENLPPTFRILGNHCYGEWTWGIGSADNATFQILYSYLLKGQFSPELFQQFFSYQLYLSKLRKKYNMPSRSYVLYPNIAAIYMVDSTPFIREWLRSDRGRLFIKNKFVSLYGEHGFEKHYSEYLKIIKNEVIENNPADELYRNYHLSDVVLKILTLHHPVHFTADTRAYDSDAKLYLSKEEIKLLEKLDIVGCYGEMLGKIFEIEKLSFDLILSGHVHSMYLYNDLKGRCQIVSGAAGAKLQHHRNFSDINNLLLFAREHGFVEVRVYPNKKMTFLFHSIKDNVWIFSSNSQEPVRQYEDIKTSYFRQTILTAVDKYFKFLNAEQTNSKGGFLKLGGNASHNDKGVDRANALKNYFTKFQVDDLLTTIKTVCDIIKDSGDRIHSLKTMITDEVSKIYHIQLSDLLVCKKDMIFPFEIRKKIYANKSANKMKFFHYKTTDNLPKIKFNLSEEQDNKNLNTLS